MKPATCATQHGRIFDMAKKPKISIIALETIVAATRGEHGFMFATPESVKPHLDNGNAEQNNGMANPQNANEFATRATMKGMQEVDNKASGADNTTTNEAPKADDAPKFQRVKLAASALPAKAKRGGGGQPLYPFDELVAPTGEGDAKEYDGFFVGATAAKPEPWKSLQSAVSAATRRYATKTGEKSFTNAKGEAKTRSTYDYTRKFDIVQTEIDGKKGAYVRRTQ